MPVTERVMGIGDWSLRLRDDTPTSVRQSIDTPFGLLVITEGRLPTASLIDATALNQALYAGVCLRPGPQFELGGVGLLWFLQGTGQTFGPGLATTLSISAGSLSTAMTTVLSGTGLSSGTISAGTVAAYSGADVLRGQVLRQLADQLGFEFRVNPDLTVDVGTAATLYGSSPSAVVVRRVGPKEVASPYGIVGTVASTWDYEGYASSAIVWTTSERQTAGGASAYRGPTGSLMTIYKGYEFTDAPSGAGSGIATQLVSEVNRAVRTVEVTSSDYAVTGVAECGGSVWLYDPDNGLYDTTQQVTFGGGIIQPISARVMSTTWPVERGMGVYYRLHDGTNVSYVDLSDYIEWESPGARFEVSTAAQWLAPQRSTTLQDLWSPWQPYACEWRATTTNPTLGNGVLDASFRRLGTACDVRITLTIGSTSTGGTGNWVFTMPPGCAARTVSNSYALGKTIYSDGGVTFYEGGCYVVSAGTDIYPTDGGSPFTNVSSTVPFAWAAGDTLNITLTLEIDP